jgi:RND family efflux transporter MFP subunit
LIALLAALAAGAYWHQPIFHAIGLDDHSGAGSMAGTKQLWTCGMHPQVIQDKPGLCPICQMKLQPLNVALGAGSGTGATADAKAQRKVAYWWDPMMNPPYISDRAGKSPMGMDLIPRYEDELSAGTSVKIDPVVVQNMGVRVARVSRGPVRQEIRAVGYLQEAQPNVRDVNLRVSGWVEKLHADTIGMAVSRGTPLFDLYSPEVQVAAEELIAARQSLAALPRDADAVARKTSQTIFDATRLKLEQWGLDAAQVGRLAQLDHAPRTVTFTSPIDGYVMQKMVVQGSAVKLGDMALRIVDLSTVWLDAQVYAQDLPFIKLGQSATAEVEGVPGKVFEGKVVFIHPQVDPQTRTVTVRMALSNQELSLRPGLYATSHIESQVADDAVLVPLEAVLDTGTRQVVFVAEGHGQFSPRRVRTGSAGSDGTIQVVDGLAPGETVVSSGQFLLDAESRMREAVQKHLRERLLVDGSTAVATAAPAAPTATAPEHNHAASAGREHTMLATTAALATAPSAPSTAPVLAEADRVFVEYLALQKVLGAPQKADAPLDPSSLLKAADALAQAADGEGRSAARAVLDAASALHGQPLAEQRKGFKRVSEAAIALARVMPPSGAVAPVLFIAHCPMAPGEGARWLQPTEAIANPYFATSMKDCGTIEGKVETRAGGAAGQKAGQQ